MTTASFSAESSAAPKVTAAIPTLGRPRWAIEAATSILAGQQGGDFEILVLDNGCDAALERAVRQLERETVRYIPVPQVGLHNARHAAVEHARSNVLAYIDDDVLVDDGWLAAIADSFENRGVHLVGGPCRPLFDSQPPAWLEAMWQGNEGGLRWLGSLSLIDGGASAQDVDPRLIFGANFAIRKQTLQRVGGFHPDGVPWAYRMFRGDGETAVSAAVDALGLRSVFNPSAAVRHRVPPERMTEAYFERRSMLQGISDSFTDVRARRDSSRGSVADMVRGLRQRMSRAMPGRQRSLRKACHRAWVAGYAYHQEQTQRVPAVREWVHRTHYWDAEIPVIGM